MSKVPKTPNNVMQITDIPAPVQDVSLGASVLGDLSESWEKHCADYAANNPQEKDLGSSR